MGLGELGRDLAFAAGVLRRRPFQVLIQVTNRCNMTCDFCGFWSRPAPPPQELQLADYQALEGELSRLGKFLVSLEGGEPFVRKDLPDIVRIFAARHLPMLYTNGWYVTPENARALFDAGLVQVGVSLDYPDAARHDARRGQVGAFERAVRALDILRRAAPHGGRQVHVMTVLMEDNHHDLEALLELSAAHQVQHCVTVLATDGDRRDPGGAAPPAGPATTGLVELWRRFPHFKVFREYLESVDAFLAGGGGLPACRAGLQSFNIDHLGNVSPCIEKIDQVAGNVREEPLSRIHQRLTERADAAGCQSCWTVCRGFHQALGGGGSLRGWFDLATRMRSA